MAAISNFTSDQLETICKVLADTGDGLTGTEIGRMLEQCGIKDPNPALAKHKRLFNALCLRQNDDHCGNSIANFIQATMAPARYLQDTNKFLKRRIDLNEVLSFCGMSLGEDGKLLRIEHARTLNEAQSRAGRLRSALQARGVHADVLFFCQAELMQDNYFHAVFEATKSVAEKIRNKSGLTGDGSDLVDKAFGLGSSSFPILAFNSLRTETEQSEHKGLMNLIKGMFGAFRNVAGHAPKVTWSIEEQDAMDLLVLASFLHRRLDKAIPTAPKKV